MEDQNRESSGEYAREASDEDILAAVRDHNPAATSEVAEAVDLTRQAVDYRLRQLEKDERVIRKKIAASLVWSPVGNTAESVDTEATTEHRRERSSHDGRSSLPEQTPSTSGWRDQLSEIELEGAGSRLEARKKALEAIVTHLEEHGEATAGKLKEIASEYDHGYDNADGYWSNMRRQDIFDDLPVETPGRGGRKYRFDSE